MSVLRRFHGYFRKINLICIVIIIIYCGLYVVNNNERKPQVVIVKSYTESSVKRVPKEEKSSVCERPKLDPFAKEIMKFHKDYGPIKCKPGFDWVKCFMSTCKIVPKVMETMEDVKCTFKDIIFITDFNRSLGNPTVIEPGQEYTLVASDHVKILCTGRLKDSGTSSAGTKSWIGHSLGYKNSIKPKKPPPGRENTINVLIFGFDSTSRNGFIRKMPKSYKVLTEELGATELQGYNVVGDGTVTNLIPFLVGKTWSDFTKANKGVNKSKYIDHKELIFHKVKEDGYRTAYFEDSPTIPFYSFRHQPADHYIRPFYQEEKNGSQKYCVGDKPRYKIMMNITNQFHKLDGKRFSFTFIGDISHDEFNVIGDADIPVSEFLRGLKTTGQLENTLLIVMGDHGVRFNKDLRNSYQGKLEERLPLMAIRIPEQLRAARPDIQTALETNSEALTTPHDMHTTVLDAVGLRRYWIPRQMNGARWPRGLTLFEPIPRDRLCSEAGITPYWCACVKWNDISMDDPLYPRVAEALQDHINNLTEPLRSMCAVRRIRAIHWVMKMDKKFEGKVKIPKNIYQVKITVTPGTGNYEAAVVHDTKPDVLSVKTTEISRTNASKMKLTVIITTILITQAAVIQEECDGIYINEIYHDIEVLKGELDRPYLLAMDHVTNTLYFSYSMNAEDDEFKTAMYNVNTKTFKNIEGVNNGFAQTVDPETNEVYIGGTDGIYKYNYNTDTAEFYGAQGENIWSVYYKDTLYYSTFPSQFLYTYTDGETRRFKELEDTKVDHLIIDKDDKMYYTNGTGLYSQQKGLKNATLIKEFEGNSVRGMTLNSEGDVFVCFADGIYVVKKSESSLDKVVDLTDVFGIAFDNSNYLIYSDATQLIRLKPNKHKNC